MLLKILVVYDEQITSCQEALFCGLDFLFRKLTKRIVLETGLGRGQFQLIGRVRVQFLINRMMNLVIGSIKILFQIVQKKASPSIEANFFPDRLNLKKPDRSNLKKCLASN